MPTPTRLLPCSPIASWIWISRSLKVITPLQRGPIRIPDMSRIISSRKGWTMVRRSQEARIRIGKRKVMILKVRV